MALRTIYAVFTCAVRQNLINVAVAQTDKATINAFADAFSWVADHDYPDRWVGLPSAMLPHLMSGDPQRTTIAAMLLHQARWLSGANVGQRCGIPCPSVESCADL